MTARVRNLILLLAGGAFVLVLFDKLTGSEWTSFVAQLLGGLL